MSDVITHLTSNIEPVLSEPLAVLYFSAPWCGPCKNLKPIIEAYEQAHPELKFVKINIDEQPDLSTLYHIRAVPTLIVLRDGAEAARKIGSMSASQLNELIDNA